MAVFISACLVSLQDSSSFILHSYLIYHVCIYVCVCLPVFVEVRGELYGIDSLLPLYRFGEWNPGFWICVGSAVPTEPSCWPKFPLFFSRSLTEISEADRIFLEKMLLYILRFVWCLWCYCCWYLWQQRKVASSFYIMFPVFLPTTIFHSSTSPANY